MERPQVDIQSQQRDITGEIVYLDEMRRQNVAPDPFQELAGTAIQAYEAQAKTYEGDERPAIMDEYERHDHKPSPVIASCIALANELLALKDPETPLTFVDIVVETDPDTVLAKIQAMAAGSLLADEDEQLAIPSDGSYYPILDIRKQNAKFIGVGLRVWGWDSEKYVFTNGEDEQYEFPKHALLYPSEEKNSTRQLEISFGYEDEEAGSFVESVSLYIYSDGSATISRSISASAYSETGYEGHAGSSLEKMTDNDIAAFGDLVAEIVGDKPESVGMRIDRQLQEITEAAATPSAQRAIQELIDATWPAQARYLLSRNIEGTDTTIAEQIRDEATVDAAITAIHTTIQEWQEMRQG